MEVTPTRRSARIAALQKKKEEEARNDASTTTNPKISPKKAQASKKGIARRKPKKAQAPKNVHTPTQKKAQASKDGTGQLHDDGDVDVDGLTENLQNFSINGEEDSVSSPDEDEGSIYEEESEDESVDEDARKPTKSKSHTPRKSEPDSQQEDETNTSYSISFGTCYLREKIDLEADTEIVKSKVNFSTFAK